MKRVKQPPASLIAALKYAELGWASFPVAQGKKAPAIQGGFKSASNDPDTLGAYWRRRPDTNIGVATGDASGIIVLDIDPRNGGDESLTRLEKAHGELPQTVWAQTGGGGRHFFFKAPDAEPVRCSVLAEGIDLKASGGYVVVAPSVHPSGGKYRWELSPFDHEPAEAPPWMLKRSPKRQEDKAKPRATSNAADSILGKLFADLGMLGRDAGDGKRVVICPWEGEHSGGAPFDSSTVIFPANEPGGLGGFHCSHSHCAKRTAPEALRHLRRRRDEQEGENQWRGDLKRTQKGVIRPTFRNVCLILEHDEKYNQKLRWNEMLMSISLDEVEVTDSTISGIRVDLDERYDLEVSEADVVRAVPYVAGKRSFHPVRDYLNALVWDGTPRIHRVATEILNTKVTDTEELRLTVRMLEAWFITLVGRPLRPKIKVDTTLILQGAQGTGKSTFFRVLGGDWFTDTDMALDKDGMMLLSGVWICEWAELENVMTRSSNSKVKQFLASAEDRFRPPFGRSMLRVARSSVIVGTTNLDDFLRDPTGSRRFWVIPVGRINTQLLTEWRIQLLAEAVERFNRGEQHWLSESDEEKRLAFSQQFSDSDPWDDKILQFIHDDEQVRIPDILSTLLGIEPERQERRQQHRVAGILRRHGWRRTQTRINGRPTKVWVPPHKKKGDVGD